jgi:hypothetical protein
VLLDNLTLADRFLWRAVEIKPLRPATHLHLGLLRRAQGDLYRAQVALEMALTLDPHGAVGQMAKRILFNLHP